jgi:hypothetical protein
LHTKPGPKKPGKVSKAAHQITTLQAPKKEQKRKAKKQQARSRLTRPSPKGWSQKNMANAHYRSATFFCAQPCIRARARCEKQLSFLSFFLLVQAG